MKYRSNEILNFWLKTLNFSLAKISAYTPVPLYGKEEVELVK